MSAHVAALYAQHHAWLLAWLRGKLRCPHSAADLAHDTFVRALTARQPGEGLAEPRAYLTTLAQRVLFSHWRRRELEQAYLQALASAAPHSQAPSAEELAVLREVLEAIDRLLGGLPPKVRQAFLLHRIDERTQAQIARDMGLSLATVERYIKRAYLHCCQLPARDPSA